MESFNATNMWYYYLSLSDDMTNTSRYVEPHEDQENVFSFEFSKIIILSCIEIEAAFKAICKVTTGKQGGNMSEYKQAILEQYPRIVDTEVNVNRYGKTIRPFESWTGRLFWWDAYQSIKHGYGESIKNGTYKNAVYCLAALYVLALYYIKITNSDVSTHHNGYISSDYEDHGLSVGGMKQLPDFQR